MELENYWANIVKYRLTWGTDMVGLVAGEQFSLIELDGVKYGISIWRRYVVP